MKNVLIAAAALTMIAGTASANPDKWDLRGADQVSIENQAAPALSFETDGVDFATTASIGSGVDAVDTGEIAKPHQDRMFNR